MSLTLEGVHRELEELKTEVKRRPARWPLVVLGAFLVPLAAAMVSLVWSFTTDLYEQGSLNRRVTPTPFKIPINKDFATKLGDITDFHALIVHYGANDKELPATATDRDRNDYKRQFTSIPVYFRVDDGQNFLEFTLPVHQYLGTKFKLYATPKKSSKITAKDLLKKFEEAQLKDGICKVTKRTWENADKEAEPFCVELGGTHWDKVYFLLDWFGVVPTSGGIFDNYVPPA